MNNNPDIYGPTPVLFNKKPDGFPKDYPSPYVMDEVFLGTLYDMDEAKLSWTYRNKFMPDIGKQHIARTPFYAIRWAIEKYTNPGDTVLDPFMGSGTTGAEAMIQGRKTIGIELEFPHITEKTFKHFDPSQTDWKLYSGDAEELLDSVGNNSCHLLNLSNPYFGDSDTSPRKGGGEVKYEHEKSTKKMTNTEYWRKMKAIQDKACSKLVIGGHLIFVIKDLVKAKKIDPLHVQFADLVPNNMEFIGTVALPHHPGTLFTNSYEKMHGVRPPKEQLCPIFKRIS
tara:strand:+ start:2611 stop:3459 length:849 start_codon:yes stop_codon:yes gene_type:complete